MLKGKHFDPLVVEKFLAIKLSKIVDVFLTENHKTSVPALQYLQKNIWNFEASAFDKESNDAISSVLCETPYSESDIVASEIKKAVQLKKEYYEQKE